MSRIQIKVGSVFEVQLSSGKKYFQYVVENQNQLYSQVICVFKKEYKNDYEPNVAEIVVDEIDFFAHVFIKLGITYMNWKKIGSTKAIQDFSNTVFVVTNERGHVESCTSWWIKGINCESTYVGDLVKDPLKKYEIGMVINPKSIEYRMENGVYDFYYPKF